MKILLIIIFILANIISGQDSLTVNNLKLNFAVPDIPAFTALNIMPSNILRPSTPEALGLLVSEFNKGGNLSLPSAFAVEIAPFLLAKYSSITLKDFIDNRTLYGIRISAASFKDSLNLQNVSVGLRINIIDDGDPRNDKVIANEIQLLSNVEEKKTNLRLQYLQDNGNTMENFANDKALQEKVKTMIDNKFNEEVNEEIEKIREDYKNEHWNDQKLDLAIAWVGFSPDSLIKNVSFKNLQLWFMWGYPVFNGGQLLLGITQNFYKYEPENKIYFNLSIPARLYIGINDIKAFGEFQYSYNQLENKQSILFNSGIELNLLGSVWLNGYAGIEKQEKKSYFKTNIDFRYTLPENIKLF